jgi:hypothetical protein
MRALTEEFLLWQDRVLVAVILEGLLIFLAAGALCWFACHCDCGCWRRKAGDGDGGRCWGEAEGRIGGWIKLFR